MNHTRMNHSDIDEHAPFLLAMHSCTETLGVATVDLRNTNQSIRCETFPLGRRLSNNLINCIEKLLPAQNWSLLTPVNTVMMFKCFSALLSQSTKIDKSYQLQGSILMFI